MHESLVSGLIALLCECLVTVRALVRVIVVMRAMVFD